MSTSELKSTTGMNVNALKTRLNQRMGLHLINYIGDPACNDDWVKGYEQAKKDIKEAIEQIEIYMPYLDES
tara:strand:+ start:438 stop:650 length:213 start_codon:yes stop_codon:yes gene_type:complete